jgi:hypothetical protein
MGYSFVKHSGLLIDRKSPPRFIKHTVIILLNLNVDGEKCVDFYHQYGPGACRIHTTRRASFRCIIPVVVFMGFWHHIGRYHKEATGKILRSPAYLAFAWLAGGLLVHFIVL